MITCVIFSPEHNSGSHKNIAADTQHHVDCYAKEGLRTLCFTKKVHNRTCCHLSVYLSDATRAQVISLHVLQVVSDNMYESWSVNRRRALAAIDNREELIMDTAVQLETDLSLIGTMHQLNTHRSWQAPCMSVS